MTSFEERWGMTEEELGAIFAANAAKAKPWVEMYDSDDSYEEEDEHGLQTPPPEYVTASAISRRPRPKPPAEPEFEFKQTKSGRVVKRRISKKSPRYPVTRSRGMADLSLDLRKNGYINFEFGTKILNVSFKAYMREHDPDLWSHLTPEEHRDRNFDIGMRKRPNPSYKILPDGRWQSYEKMPDGTLNPVGIAW